MDRKKIIIALCAAVLLQLMVLSGMLVLAAMPLWTGKEIRVKVVPVDPRSLFRGNYARLNYDFSRLEKGALAGNEKKTCEITKSCISPCGKIKTVYMNTPLHLWKSRMPVFFCVGE